MWDIEDLVALGERAHGCPYFAARQIAELPTTELVLCPYNYLIDPLIRKAMSIDLEGAIIIIDEAHNVEDVSRNAASREIDLSDLKHTELELTRLIESFIDEGSEERKTHFVTIRKVISELIMWIQDTIPNIRQQHTKQQTPSSSSSQAAFKSTQTNQEMEQLTSGSRHANEPSFCSRVRLCAHSLLSVSFVLSFLLLLPSPSFLFSV